MGANERRRPSRRANQRTPHLPQYVIEHIGQVLRNRFREYLLVPVPGEMLDQLARMRPAQSVVPAGLGPKLEGSNPQVTGRSEKAPNLGSRPITGPSQARRIGLTKRDDVEARSYNPGYQTFVASCISSRFSNQ